MCVFQEIHVMCSIQCLRQQFSNNQQGTAYCYCNKTQRWLNNECDGLPSGRNEKALQANYHTARGRWIDLLSFDVKSCAYSPTCESDLLLGRRRLIGSSWPRSPAVNSPGWLLWIPVQSFVCVWDVGVHPERWALHWGAATSAQLSNREDPSSRTAQEQWSCWSTCTDGCSTAHMQAYTTWELYIYIYIKLHTAFTPKATAINPPVWEQTSPNECNAACYSASHHLYWAVGLLPRAMNSYCSVITPSHLHPEPSQTDC